MALKILKKVANEKSKSYSYKLIMDYIDIETISCHLFCYRNAKRAKSSSWNDPEGILLSILRLS